MNLYLYLYIVKTKEKHTIDGLNERQVLQIIQIKMTEKVVPSKKVYTRKLKHKNTL